MNRPVTRFCACAALTFTGLAVEAKVIFDLDYSLDANGFFDGGTANGRAARAALERAARTFSDRIVDNLTSISPGGGNTWAGQIIHPATGGVATAPATSVPANVLKVYVGGRVLTAPEVAAGGAGTATVTGSSAFVNNANARGQAGALANPKTDFGPWGGHIAFDEETAWYFGLPPGGIPVSRIDFITVATHEFAHLLGFSANQASWANRVINAAFSGTTATAANGGVQPAVTGSHWNGLISTVGGVSQPALMNASTPVGVRRRMTALDWGAMADVGWLLAMPGDANADGAVDFTDFQIFELGFGTANACWADGDFNEDGLVSRADFMLLYRNFGKRLDGGTAPPAAAAQADALDAFGEGQGVPEPGIVSAVAGLAMTALRRRRRERVA